MELEKYLPKAQAYLETLCAVKPNRRTGSAGNRDAIDFFAKTIRPFSYELDVTPFACLDYACNGAALTHNEEAFEVIASPYSLGCDLQAELVTVSTVEDLESVDCEGKILLMKDEICSEPLMPKNFVFYNPEHHQKIIALLESHKPAAIITATAKRPEQAGALYPFPLFYDGDFDIPSVFCRDTLGEILAARPGELVRLKIDASRIPSSASNVIARLNPGAAKKIVLTAHIDAYEGSTGASDNAAGTTVLLLCAELLSDYQGEYGIEIAAFNGEDHYSAGGQMDYLSRYGSELAKVVLGANIDGVGYKLGRSAYSFYGLSPELEQQAGEVFNRFAGLVAGEQWYQGDHMIFVQGQVPVIAFTSERALEMLQTIIHTTSDTPDMIDYIRIVEVAGALNALIRSL